MILDAYFVLSGPVRDRFLPVSQETERQCKMIHDPIYGATWSNDTSLMRFRQHMRFLSGPKTG